MTPGLCHKQPPAAKSRDRGLNDPIGAPVIPVTLIADTIVQFICP